MADDIIWIVIYDVSKLLNDPSKCMPIWTARNEVQSGLRSHNNPQYHFSILARQRELRCPLVVKGTPMSLISELASLA